MRGRALITGATAGIGNAFARELARRGHDLVLVARDTERLEKVAAGLHDKYGVEVDVVTADLTTDDGLQATVNAVTDTARPVDLLVNNAGASLAGWFGSTDIADEDHQLDLMVRAPMHLMDAAIKAMTGRGHGEIVNVASVAAFTPRGTYSAHKSWIVNLSRWAHIQYADAGVTVMALCPGFVRTEFHQRMGADTATIPRWMWLKADKVVRASLKDLDKRKALSVPTVRYKILATLSQYAPKPLVAKGCPAGPLSTPRTLTIPEGVEARGIKTPVGVFAAHVARTEAATGHVLLIPGWTGSKEDFTPLLPLLAAAGLDATAYDQRGQFETPGGAEAYTLDGYAADALAVAAVCSDHPSHLLGHSFGGLVAQRAALAQPSAWQSLSLLDSGPGALGETPTRPLSMIVNALGTVPMAAIHRAREQALGVKRKPDIAEFVRRRFTSNDPMSLKVMTQALIDAPDLIDEVAALPLPFWVGRGADDDAWPHDTQAAMAQRLGTEIHVIEDSAHSPAIENTQGLIDAWLPFLTSS